jgi:hypothetical protein
MRTIAIVSAAAGLLLAATPALAQQGWSNLRELLLDQATETMAEDGFLAAGEFHEGSLADDGSERVALHLRRGQEIVVVGFCDFDCEDLDMTLYDAAGSDVGSDTKADDVPIIRMTPGQSGTYRLEVTMADCRRDPCSYGVQRFE